MKKTYNVYFSGELLAGQDIEQTKAGLAEIFNISGDRLNALFRGKPVCVKKEVSADRAGRLRKKFLELGALVEIVPAGSSPERARQPQPEASPRQEAMKQAYGLSLAPMAPLETPPQPDPVEIDISGLELVPHEAMEPIFQERDAAPIPDISNLSLASPTDNSLMLKQAGNS